MKRAAVLSLCTAVVVTVSGCARGGDGSLDTEFHDRLVAFNTAVARADTAALGPQIADDLIWVIGATGDVVGKTRLLAAASTPQDPVPHFDVDSVRVRRAGDVAMVDYRRTDRRRVGGYELSFTWRVFETYVRTGARWQVARHIQTWVHQAPSTPAAMDSATLAAFVGRYEIDPSYIDNVHFEGRELVATPTGQKEGGHLVPVSENAFVPDGIGALLVFERDRRGRVIGYIQGYPDGRVLRARKID
jgi:ketosteroid isomerase-like protein